MNRAPSIARQEEVAPATYAEIEPGAARLAGFECFWIGGRSGEPHYEILPDGCMDVVFEFAPARNRVLLFGTTTRSTAFAVAPEAEYFGLRFQPGCAPAALPARPAEIADRHEDLPDFLGIGADQLRDAGSAPARRALLEARLTTIAGPLRETAVVRAVRLIRRNRGRIGIAELAQACNIGARQLERQFVQQVGVSPKSFCRFTRLRSAFDAFAGRAHGNLADLAAELGYTDQSHFIRDFKSLTGRTPGAAG